MIHSNLVSKFKCNIYNDIYYGKDKRHFKFRACEHVSTTPVTVKIDEKTKKSTVFDHIVHTGHNAHFDDFEPLSKGYDEFRLLSSNF